MKREEVLLVINGERNRQNAMAHHSDKMDQEASIATWIIYMEKMLEDAKTNIYVMDERQALNSIRKLTALGVACMEHNT